MRKEGSEARHYFKVAFAGNPNVGKSTLFNALTGKSVHTGNWAGKTVGCESATVEFEDSLMQLIDIPGTYSLFSHSEEERIARDYICFGGADVTVVVCDATALMQNLNLVLQIAESGRKIILYLNFISEAVKNGITVDTALLSRLLGVAVITGEAYKKKTHSELLSEIRRAALSEKKENTYRLEYSEEIEACAEVIFKKTAPLLDSDALARWVSLRLIDADGAFLDELLMPFSEFDREEILEARSLAREDIRKRLGEGGLDSIAEAIVKEASKIAEAVTKGKRNDRRGERLDKILTGKMSAYPSMIALLFLVMWITLSLANYPSMLLSDIFSFFGARLLSLFEYIGAPGWLCGVLINGMLKTLGQVVAVMLPPMVIFFPLFALLEDSGYLPRIAYNLDRPFACSGACGKQALTMCMGLGCNAVGIVGCRIIDSKRERSLATVTNSLMPCNGRLPMLVTFISVFCSLSLSSVSSLAVALILSSLIMISVAMTFISTAALSRLVLKGERTPFTIELVPFRKPRFIPVIFHSLRDKCLSVLLRAVMIAAPVGILIWILANISVSGDPIILLIADFLDPLGRLAGMDGVIILAFILGLPANEIVIPIMLMIYSSASEIGADVGFVAIRETLISAGWSIVTVICVTLFALFHWPCSTSLMTVYKETHSKKLTFISFLLPTLIGFTLCLFVNVISKIFI